jgi:hypothetical protein
MAKKRIKLKTRQLSFRVSDDVCQLIDRLGGECEWTASRVVHVLCRVGSAALAGKQQDVVQMMAQVGVRRMEVRVTNEAKAKIKELKARAARKAEKPAPQKVESAA